MSKQMNPQCQNHQSQSQNFNNILNSAGNQQRLNSSGAAFTPVKKTILFPSVQHNTCSQQPLNKFAIFLAEEDKKETIRKLLLQIQELTQRVAKLQKIINQNKKNKRIRRKSTHIHKSYKCTHKQCDKNYGSQTALKKHKRTKHQNQDDSNIQMQKMLKKQ